MYAVKATEELITQFLTKGNKVWEGKCFEGLPRGCKLEKVETETSVHGGLLIVAMFSHPEEENPEEVKSIRVNYETKWTRKTLNSIRKQRH